LIICRRTICQQCNQGIRLSSKPVIIGHGITTKELHSILKGLTPEVVKRAKIICRSHDDIVSLSLDGIRFIDSKLFLATDLDNLIGRQWAGHTLDDFPKLFPLFYTMMKPSLYLPLLFKDIWFPNRFNNWREVSDLNFMPIDKNMYIDSLTGKIPENDDLGTSVYVFNKFECTSLREFHQLLSLSKLLLLADVINSFVQFAMETFLLSPLCSYSLSSYAYDACMSSIGKGFQYIKDYDMIKFVMDSVKAGPAITSCRYIKSNCERLYPSWNGISEERSHCLSIDQNSMYPFCLMGQLPFSDYEWMTEEEINDLNLMKIGDDDEIGYLLDCKIKYPKHLHDRDKNLPFCVTKRRVKKSELSENQKIIWDSFKDDVENPLTSEKIIMDLHDKVSYTAYGTTIKYYMSMGIEIMKINRGLKFKQRAFLKSFFEKTLQLRNKAQEDRDDVFQLFLKAILCRIFGVMLSNTAKFTDTIICFTRTDALQYLSRHNFMNYTVINPEKEIIMFHMRKSSVHYKHPILCSAVALDKAKVELYTQWVNIQTVFPGAKHCFTDTDSITAWIPDTRDNYFERLKLLPKMDFSSIHTMHCLYNVDHKNEPGFWKIVNMDIIEIVAPRPKAYSVLISCDRCHLWSEGTCPCLMKKCMSGVPRADVLQLTHQMYKDSVLSNQNIKIQSTRQRAINHDLVMINSFNAGFQGLNVGRYFLEDNINSLPFGHYSIQCIPDLVSIT